MPTTNIYRVRFIPTTDAVEVIVLGMDAMDMPHQGTYLQASMPDWMQDKLASLALLHPPPPENDVAGVGKRISDSVFWVYPD